MAALDWTDRATSAPETRAPDCAADATLTRERIALEPILRAVSGALVTAYYVQHLRYTTSVWGRDGIWPGEDVTGGTVVSPLASSLLRLGGHALMAWFAFGAALGVLLAIGVLPRACAALLVVVGAVTYQACLPWVTLDDYMAPAAAFWWLLLGTPLRAPTLRARSTSRRPWAAVLCVTFFAVAIVHACLASASLPPAVRLAIFAACACAIAPVGRWRWLAILPVAFTAFHLTCVGGAGIGCGLLLMLGAMAAVSRSRVSSSSVSPEAPFDLAAGVGASAVALSLVLEASMILHFLPLERSSGLALAAMGLSPFPGFELQETSDPTLDVSFRMDAPDSSWSDGVARGNPRLRAILRWLDDTSDAHASDRAALVRSLVAQHCRRARDGGLPEPGTMSLFHHGFVARPLAWFQCQGDGAPIVVPLDGR
jgi:hypothetical protein